MFVIRVTVSLIATASVGAAFSALNSRYTVAFRPLLNEQTAIDMLRLEELKEIRLAALADLRALKKLEAA